MLVFFSHMLYTDLSFPSFLSPQSPYLPSSWDLCLFHLSLGNGRLPRGFHQTWCIMLQEGQAHNITSRLDEATQQKKNSPLSKQNSQYCSCSHCLESHKNTILTYLHSHSIYRRPRSNPYRLSDLCKPPWVSVNWFHGQCSLGIPDPSGSSDPSFCSGGLPQLWLMFGCRPLHLLPLVAG